MAARQSEDSSKPLFSNQRLSAFISGNRFIRGNSRQEALMAILAIPL
jgi:hypothetical protein